ncbi:MAG: ABC transporter ATP-binding protein [Ilumatobacteraceae bacterium]|nr:MAG: ABC transporter ATP-binding protein [Actinomycetota bacterium]
MPAAVTVSSLWKSYRLYHERNQYLKAAVLRGRRARYEEFWALKGVGFEVAAGATFGVIGSNGSGKSTLLKCLAGILQPERGSVQVNGRVSALLELGAGFHPELSGRENVFLNGAILGLSRKEITDRFDDIVEFAGLEEFIDSPVKNYSSGMFVRLGFAVAAHVEPEVLLVDEVLSVGDESFQRKSAEKIEQFRRDGRTIVFVSHGLSQVEQLCEQVAWIDKGELRQIGPAAEVISAYQGDSHHAQRVEGEQGSRWGSGEAQIVAVSLLDDEGVALPVLTTMEPATIRVELNAHAPVQDAVVGIRIDSMAGGPVWGTTTRRGGRTIGLLDGPAQVDLRLPSVPLLEGVYDLTVALTDHTEIHPYDHWERRVRFEVRQYRSYDTGVVHIPATWEIRGARGVVQGGHG